MLRHNRKINNKSNERQNDKTDDIKSNPRFYTHFGWPFPKWFITILWSKIRATNQKVGKTIFQTRTNKIFSQKYCARLNSTCLHYATIYVYNVDGLSLSFFNPPARTQKGFKMIYLCDGGPTGRLRILIKLILSGFLLGLLVYFTIATIQ